MCAQVHGQSSTSAVVVPSAVRRHFLWARIVEKRAVVMVSQEVGAAKADAAGAAATTTDASVVVSQPLRLRLAQVLGILQQSCVADVLQVPVHKCPIVHGICGGLFIFDLGK